MARVNSCNKILDYFNNPSYDWFGNTQIKITEKYLSIFLNKKILIYGLGKSGTSAYKFLKDLVSISDLNSPFGAVFASGALAIEEMST